MGQFPNTLATSPMKSNISLSRAGKMILAVSGPIGSYPNTPVDFFPLTCFGIIFYINNGLFPGVEMQALIPTEVGVSL